MKTTFELIQEYFNTNVYNCEDRIIAGYSLNGTSIKIQYKKYGHEIRPSERNEGKTKNYQNR